MGLIDRYEPIPALSCPVCGKALTEWQGREEDALMFVWRQGCGSPVEWRVDDDMKAQKEGLVPPALPAVFGLTAWDEAGHTVMAEGTAEDGVWTTTRLLAVVEFRVTGKGAPLHNVLWGSAPWLTKRDRDR
jgi:hypothetical protein